SDLGPSGSLVGDDSRLPPPAPAVPPRHAGRGGTDPAAAPATTSRPADIGQALRGFETRPSTASDDDDDVDLAALVQSVDEADERDDGDRDRDDDHDGGRA